MMVPADPPVASVLRPRGLMQLLSARPLDVEDWRRRLAGMTGAERIEAARRYILTRYVDARRV